MHFSVMPIWAAPLSTGHPFGLPDTPTRTKSTTRVAPVGGSCATDTDLMQDRSPPQDHRRTDDRADPAERTAPPTMLQLRISEILNQQAQDLLEQQAEIPKDPAPDRLPEATLSDAKLSYGRTVALDGTTDPAMDVTTR